MYSDNRRLRLIGNQPTRPGNRPSHPARPSNRPSHPARRNNRPTHPARPINRPIIYGPTHPARPSNRPSHPARPSNRPSHPARPSRIAVGKCHSNAPTVLLQLQPAFSAIRGTGFHQRGSQPSMTTLTSLQEKKNELMKMTKTTDQPGLNHLPTHSINALMRQRERARQLSAHEMSSVINSQQSRLISAYPHQSRPIGKTSQNNDFSQLLNYYDSDSNNDFGVGSTADISQNVITLPSLTNRPVLSSQTLNNHASFVLPPISVAPKPICNGIEKARNFPGIRKTTDTLSNTTPLPPLPAATTLDGSRITSVAEMSVQNSNHSLTCHQRADGTRTTHLPAESQSNETYHSPLSPWNGQPIV